MSAPDPTVRPVSSATGAVLPEAARRALRDVGVAVVLIFVAFQLFAEAADREPGFATGDIHVVEAAVAGYETVQVFETAPAPNLNSQQMVSRSALRLEGYPPNLLVYIPGSPWQFETDIPVGTAVRVEAAEDPEALATRARAFPDARYLLVIEGLQTGERVYFRASDEIARAEAAALSFRRLGVGTLLLALAWLGWALWWRRDAIRRLIFIWRTG